MQKPEEFWNWFKKNAAMIGEAKGIRAKFAVRKVDKQIRKCTPNLVFQWGADPAGGHVFEVSADGIPEHIPEVERFVASAPPIPGWKIVAFRQPCAVGAIKLGRSTLSVNTVRYQSARQGNLFDLTIYYPEDPAVPEDRITGALFLLLDALIGEYAVMTKFEQLEFVPVTEAPIESKPLSELPQELGFTPT